MKFKPNRQDIFQYGCFGFALAAIPVGFILNLPSNSIILLQTIGNCLGWGSIISRTLQSDCENSTNSVQLERKIGNES